MTVREIEAACDAQRVRDHVPHPLDAGPLPLRARFYPFGFALEVRTNAAEVLDMYSKLWPERAPFYDFAAMQCDVYVAPGGPEQCPPNPYYLYQRPIFTSIADGHNHVVVDMERGRAWMSLTTAVLRQRLYLESFFLMMPLATLPVKGVHAACVAWRGKGIMLCGDSGAGKSTLSYACARAGWDYISDDMCLLVDGAWRLVAGNSDLVRFRPAAAELFPEIRGLELTPRAAGKPSIELSTFSMSQVRRCQQTRVDFVVFLNRRDAESPALVSYRKDVARLYMSQGVYGCDQQECRHLEAVDLLLRCDVFELRYSDLDWAVDRLLRLAEDGP